MSCVTIVCIASGPLLLLIASPGIIPNERTIAANKSLKLTEIQEDHCGPDGNFGWTLGVLFIFIFNSLFCSEHPPRIFVGRTCEENQSRSKATLSMPTVMMMARPTAAGNQQTVRQVQCRGSGCIRPCGLHHRDSFFVMLSQRQPSILSSARRQ